MNKPEWIVFDIGGVLFDYRQALHNVASLIQVSDSELLTVIYTYIEDFELGRKEPIAIWKKIKDDLQVTKTPEEMLNTWWGISQWVEDTQALITQLHSAHYALALFTNNWKGMLHTYMTKLDIFPLFSHVIDSSVAGIRKPSKDFYLLVENTINAKGEKIFFIDDSKDNLHIGSELGWQTFLYDLGDDKGITSNKKLREILL